MDFSLTWVFSVLAAIMLFLFGLSAFSEEIARIGGDKLQNALRRLTRTDLRGVLVGGLSTAVIQSSSAVTSMAVGLAHQRVLTDRGAFAVMIGANIGTTLTAWLVALKIPGLGPAFVAVGGLWSLVAKPSWRPYGKAIFYFGLIFLALDLIAESLAPLAQRDQMLAWTWLFESKWLLLAFGALATAIVQSSSVVSGLAVLVVAQGIVSPHEAVWMIAGANVGTTSTALLAGSAFGPLSRRLALLNTAFNLLGVLLFVTALQPIVNLILALPIEPGEKVALVHTAFNILAGLVALLLIQKTWPILHRWLSQPSP